MELNLLSLFGISIALMVLVFFLYFIIRAAKCYHDATSNIGRIIAGTLIAGGGSGMILGFCLWCVLPTHYYITNPQAEGYYTRYVINSEFSEEYGRTYIINLTDQDYYLCAMTYGNKSLDDDEEPIIPLTAGYIVEIKHEVDKWFEPFPDQVSTKEKGEIRWHVLTESQAQKEFE